MVTDDLINTLSRAHSIRVISRQSVRSYRGAATDIAAIGSELQVKYILDGTMRMHGDKLRINVELIDTATRLPVWSTRIDRDSAERRAVPDEIVGRLARELHFEMFTIESERRSDDHETDTLIYRGWAAIFAHGTAGLETLRQAEHFFTQALERDPESKSARSGLGAYHALAGTLQLDADIDAHLTKAEEILRQMAREGFQRAAQYFYLGIVHRVRGRLDEAIEVFARALELNPSLAPAHAHLGHTLLWKGQAREGLEHIRYALKLSPRDAIRSHWLRFAGEAELELGHHREAVDYLQQSYTLNPRIHYTARALAAAHALSGRMQEAQKYYAELKALMPHRTGDKMLRRPAAIEIAQAELTRGLKLLKWDQLGN
jgi:tetratricopeptide (TPR) repeat protein